MGHLLYNWIMPRRYPVLANGDIYHIYNRGVEKRSIYLSDSDFKHFLETLEHYRTPNINKHSKKTVLKVGGNPNFPLVEILSYCLMPNHFHLLLEQKSDNGISIFMSRVANSFTKYFNIKNERIGPLFQGTFKAVKISTDEQLVHISRYIHLNPLVSRIVVKLNEYL